VTTDAPAIEQVENVTGRRVVAGFIDVVILGVIFVLMSALSGGTESEDGSFSANLDGGPALLFFLIVMGYYLVPEALSGQTIGKKIMGLRVVSLAGPLTWGKVAIRTILRIVDAFPVFYLVGIITIAVSKKNQRIGDMAAGTVVTRA
jgi:uncharacterized RDD family membrane protein YckC